MARSITRLKEAFRQADKRLLLPLSILAYIGIVAAIFAFFVFEKDLQKQEEQSGEYVTRHGFVVSDRASDIGPLPLEEGLFARGWQEYVNNNFNYRILYPPQWIIVEDTVYSSRQGRTPSQLKALIEECDIECAAINTTVIENFPLVPCPEVQQCTFSYSTGGAMVIAVFPNNQNLSIWNYVEQVFGQNVVNNATNLITQNNLKILQRELYEEGGMRVEWYISDPEKGLVFFLNPIIQTADTGVTDFSRSYDTLSARLLNMATVFASQ